MVTKGKPRRKGVATLKRSSILSIQGHGRIAQWTRARGYEPRSRGFKSLFAHRHHLVVIDRDTTPSSTARRGRVPIDHNMEKKTDSALQCDLLGGDEVRSKGGVRAPLGRGKRGSRSLIQEAALLEGRVALRLLPFSRLKATQRGRKSRWGDRGAGWQTTGQETTTSNFIEMIISWSV